MVLQWIAAAAALIIVDSDAPDLLIPHSHLPRFVSSTSPSSVTTRADDLLYSVDIDLLANRFTPSVNVKLEEIGVSLLLQRQASFLNASGAGAWAGRTADGTGEAIFGFKEDTVIGSIRVADRNYSLAPSTIPGVHRLREMPKEKEPAALDDGWSQPQVRDWDKLKTIDISYPHYLPGNSLFYLDILTVFTNGFADIYPANQLDARLSQYFLRFNQTLADSGVNLRVRHVGKLQVDYTDEGDLQDAWRAIAFADLLGDRGAFYQVPAMRAATAADAVILFRVRKPSNDAGGWAGKFWSDIHKDFSKFAYCVVQDDRNYSFENLLIPPHEIGHLLGLDHNRFDPAPQVQLFPYSFGHRFGWDGNRNRYMTIMSYRSTGGTEQWVGHFSSPRTRYDGFLTGVEDENDAARSINEIRHIAAGWSGPSGSLRVDIRPQVSSVYEAEWSLQGDIWHDGGETVSGIPPGDHMIRFRDDSGHKGPPNQYVRVRKDRLTSLADSYGLDLAFKKITMKGHEGLSENIEINVTVKNKSKVVWSDETAVDFYLSSDDLLSEDDFYWGATQLPAIKSRKKATVAAELPKPTIPRGEYTLIGVIEKIGRSKTGGRILFD